MALLELAITSIVRPISNPFLGQLYFTIALLYKNSNDMRYKEKVDEICELGFNALDILCKSDSLGRSALHYAVIIESEFAVNYLLDNSRVGINAIDNKCRTPLMYAVLGECESMVKLLVDKGANMSLVDTDGDSANALATKKGS